MVASPVNRPRTEIYELEVAEQGNAEHVDHPLAGLESSPAHPKNISCGMQHGVKQLEELNDGRN